MKKIGILGGTFNPIHNGHLILAQNALEQCSLDEILFIPSGCSYMKQHVLDVKHRYRMTELAIAGHEAFRISAIEAERPGYSYTCETLQALHAQNPDVNYQYIIGADTLFSMEKWYQPEQIFASCEILCTVRSGYPMEQMLEKQKELLHKYHAQIHFLVEKAFDISSTEIRERIRNGLSVSFYLPEPVLAYIKEHEFYTNA